MNVDGLLAQHYTRSWRGECRRMHGVGVVSTARLKVTHGRDVEITSKMHEQRKLFK